MALGKLLKIANTKPVPPLYIGFALIEGVKVRKTNSVSQALSGRIIEETRGNFKIESLKDNKIIRAYRDFYWRIVHVDPTKIRPAGEALIRRVLQGKNLPQISNVVDAYNLGSLLTCLSFGAYDYDRVQAPLVFRNAVEGEIFYGIGMKKPSILRQEMFVLADQNNPLCVYPYRDSDITKITNATRRLLLMAAGVPGIDENEIISGLLKTGKLVIDVAGGTLKGYHVVPVGS
ncbi:MAG: B3/B4 domain-containing protein [Candidatus Ranarchaeia archaeon]